MKHGLQETADVVLIDKNTGEQVLAQTVSLVGLGEAVKPELTDEEKKLKRLIGIYKRTKKRRIQDKLYKRISTMLSDLGY